MLQNIFMCDFTNDTIIELIFQKQSIRMLFPTNTVFWLNNFGVWLQKSYSKSFMIIMPGLMLIKRLSKSVLLILQNHPISAVFIEYEVLIGCFSRRSVMFVCLKSDINYYGNTLYNIYWVPPHWCNSICVAMVTHFPCCSNSSHQAYKNNHPTQ